MEVFEITDIGQKRKSNEDCVFASTSPIGNLPNLFIVADGMGGHNAGEYASNFCVEYFVNKVEECKLFEPTKIFNLAIDETNKKLLDRSSSSKDYEGMGTTFVVSTILNNILYVANIGDSRLYTIGDDIKQITEDHSLVEIMVKSGEINKEEAKTHPKKNVITRAIGANQWLDVDFFETSLSNIEYILMCTDGLTNMIDDKEILSIIKNSSNAEEGARSLIKVANSNGGIDNIGVVLINVKKR